MQILTVTKERKNVLLYSWEMEAWTFLFPSKDTMLHYVINLSVVY